MKLAECLLQDRPIRSVGSKSWVTPIIHQDKTGRLYLKYMNENTCYYLNNYNFNLHDWEIKPEPMRVEFECRWRHCPEFDYYYPKVDISEFIDIVNLEKSGKRFKVTCEEIEE